MTLSKDQKRALMIGGGIVAVAILLWLLNRNGGIVGSNTGGDGPGSLDFQASPPGYTTFNMTPSNIPLAPQPIVNTNIGQGCCNADAVNDGCFTQDPLATGRGPLGMDQLLGWYQQINPQFAAAWGQQLGTYGL